MRWGSIAALGATSGSYLPLGVGVLPALALTRGYALSFRVGAAVLAVAGLLALVLLERVTATPRTALAEVPADRPPTVSSITRATP